MTSLFGALQLAGGRIHYIWPLGSPAPAPIPAYYLSDFSAILLDRLSYRADYAHLYIELFFLFQKPQFLPVLVCLHRLIGVNQRF